MQNEFRDNFLQKHPEWRDVLERIEHGKRILSSWEKLESIVNRTIDDEMVDYMDCEQDIRDDIATE